MDVAPWWMRLGWEVMGGVRYRAKYNDTNPVANNWKNEKETGL